MILQNNNFSTVNQIYREKSIATSFIANVFPWMFLALAITAVTSYFFVSNANLIGSLINPTTGGLNVIGWIVTLSPFAFVLIISFGMKKLSFSTLSLLFVIFSMLMGMSLSFILLMYTASSVFLTFIVTSATFGVMAVLGYTTKTDLTRFGSLMMMGLFGIIIASIANFFMKSSSMEYIISFIGVLVFYRVNGL